MGYDCGCFFLLFPLGWISSFLMFILVFNRFYFEPLTIITYHFFSLHSDMCI
ncbi:hypothetical protein BDV36DRAFT_273484, partial [Aspergillus pseudocaelatus]